MSAKKGKRKKQKDNTNKNILPKGNIALLVSAIIFAYTYNAGYFFITFIVLYPALCFVEHKIKVSRRNVYLKSGIDIVDKMTGPEFEKFLLAHFENLGFKGHLTDTTGDYGADLILYKDNQKIAVQAKRWVKNVGIEAVQQVVGAKDYYSVDKAMVITNSYFTPNAINQAEKSNVELWDRDTLIKIMSKAQGKELARTALNIEKIEKRVFCEVCGSEMVKRKGKYGEFYGCSRYPRCKFNKSFENRNNNSLYR